jgi:hypothetical protein
MRTDPDDLIDAATAERLLAGDIVGPRRLAKLLSEAAAPARGHELRGEEAAMAAFRAARPVTARPARRRFGAVAWARLATVKVGAIALALAVTGVALAAGTGIIPNPLPGMAPTTSTPSVPASNDFNSTSNHGDNRGGPSQAGQTPPPSQSLNGLCHAYLAQMAAKPDKVLENPNFARLVEAAGGADKVPAFCDALTNGVPSTKDADPGKSGDHPTGGPTSRPTHAPASHPDH